MKRPATPGDDTWWRISDVFPEELPEEEEEHDPGQKLPRGHPLFFEWVYFHRLCGEKEDHQLLHRLWRAPHSHLRRGLKPPIPAEEVLKAHRYSTLYEVVYDLIREFSGPIFHKCSLFGRLPHRHQIP